MFKFYWNKRLNICVKRLDYLLQIDEMSEKAKKKKKQAHHVQAIIRKEIVCDRIPIESSFLWKEMTMEKVKSVIMETGLPHY